MYLGLMFRQLLIFLYYFFTRNLNQLKLLCTDIYFFLPSENCQFFFIDFVGNRTRVPYSLD